MNRFLENQDQPLIKVCGITSLPDALASVESGANALGFNFYPPSPRSLSLGEAEKIISGLPGGVLTFAVVVHGFSQDAGYSSGNIRSKEKNISSTDEYRIPDSIDIIQVHGISEASQVPGSIRPLLIAVSPDTAPEFDQYDIIIDTSWGEGKLADWEKTAGLNRPYILSGGLNPDNIEEALERLGPAGIDVCSGVELVPGEKDYGKLKDFLGKAVAFYKGTESGNRK
jgi:phosphoribosylanthranilate isomerase